ncbi:hypothetical protein SDC9_183562 [bioreactor metagenome]|uniref:Uncharacterized protein n=1 Tax=bioreactor metagenome TaxID=1076179 RepID=A0A645HAJ6_9ZZZZ
MKLFRKIDTIAGNFIEDCLFESHPILTEMVLVDVIDEEGIVTQVEENQPQLDAEGNPQLDPQYVEEAPPQGLYLPRYLNCVWIEGGVVPEPAPQPPTLEERVADAENTLLSLLFM